ncbi:MAG: response regulator receiver modulated diguanylate cyclase [Proteobacteria bacterium]|nr:response regulator receiver modulated diguanylate cyclase [Pseudomonadota bacterium]
MKILVVEDSQSSLATLTKYVEHFGATSIPAENGEMAIDLFSRNRPDLVLLNILLPDMDGFVVAQRIRAMEKPGDWAPIIFLSSLDDDANIEKGIAAGGDDYLHKPISEIVLGAKIRAMQRIVLMRASLLAVTRKLDAANQELIRISSTDSLTGVANRRYFDEAMSIEWRRARRHSNSIALLMCDIDYFKLYNDTYGHQAGDECLRKIAAAISRHTERPSDTVARYGGEKFAVILPETSIGGALMVAEKIRQATKELNITHASSPTGQVGLSIGIASAAPGFDNPPDDLILAADKALYRAKKEGRDRVYRADAT